MTPCVYTARPTRNQRDAMQFALDVLRDPWRRPSLAYMRALRVLEIGRMPELFVDGEVAYEEIADDRDGGRLLRARLALYLRARLRADRGDCGPWLLAPTGRHCGNPIAHAVGGMDDEGRCRFAACGCHVAHRRIRPLWELAPSHGGGR